MMEQRNLIGKILMLFINIKEFQLFLEYKSFYALEIQIKSFLTGFLNRNYT